MVHREPVRAAGPVLLYQRVPPPRLLPPLLPGILPLTQPLHDHHRYVILYIPPLYSKSCIIILGAVGSVLDPNPGVKKPPEIYR